MKPILVLGLGNDILTDDAIGLRVAKAIAERLPDDAPIEVVACCEMGLGLLDHIMGHRDLVVVDAVQTGKIAPGQWHEVGEKDLPTLPGMSPHFFGVGEILTLGRRLEHEMPTRVHIFAVEVMDPFTLGTELTLTLQAALPQVVDRIFNFVQTWANEEAKQDI